jgi:hypothetical protein
LATAWPFGVDGRKARRRAEGQIESLIKRIGDEFFRIECAFALGLPIGNNRSRA